MQGLFSNERPTGNGPGRVIACPVCRGKFVLVSASKLLQNRGLTEAVNDWKRREKEEQYERFQNFIKFCFTHRGTVADFWCSTCSANICCVCLAEGGHRQHEVDHIEDMENFTRSHASVLNTLRSVEEKIPDIVSRLHKVLRHEYDIREAFFRWCKDVDDQEARGHAVISEKFKTLRNSCQGITTEIIDSLRGERTSGFETLNAIENFFMVIPSIMRTMNYFHEDNDSPSENALTNAENFLRITEKTDKANIGEFKATLEAPLTKIRETVDKLQAGYLPETRRRTPNRHQQVIHGRVTSRHGAARRGTLNPRSQHHQSVRILHPSTRLHIVGQPVTPSSQQQQQQQQIPSLQPNIFMPPQPQFPFPQHQFGHPVSASLPNGPLFFSFSSPTAAAATAAATLPLSSTQLFPATAPSIDTSAAAVSSSTSGGRPNNMGNFFTDGLSHPIETVVNTEPSNNILAGLASNSDRAGSNGFRSPLIQLTTEATQVPHSGQGQASSSATGSIDAVHSSSNGSNLWNNTRMDFSGTSTAIYDDSSQVNPLPLETGLLDVDNGARFLGTEAAGGVSTPNGGQSTGTGSSFVTPETQHTPDNPPPLDYPPGRLVREAIRDIPLPPGSPPPIEDNRDNNQSHETLMTMENQNQNNSNQNLGYFSRGGMFESWPNISVENVSSSLLSGPFVNGTEGWREDEQAAFVHDHTYYGMDPYTTGYYVENEFHYSELEEERSQRGSFGTFTGFVDSYNSYGSNDSFHRPIEIVRRRGQPSLQGRRLYAPRNLIRLPLANENLTANLGHYERRHDIEDSEHETTFMETHL